MMNDAHVHCLGTPGFGGKRRDEPRSPANVQCNVCGARGSKFEQRPGRLALNLTDDIRLPFLRKLGEKRKLRAARGSGITATTLNLHILPSSNLPGVPRSKKNA